MNDVIKIKKPNQVSNVKVSHEASSFYADLSKQWAIKLDKPIENGEYSSKYYAKISEQNADSANKSAKSAEEAASNLKKFITNSLYFPELKINNENVISNKLKLQKHSTFDKSKFTVYGNPTITDNGVARGFSSGNYLVYPNFDTSKPWNISFKFNCNKYDAIQGLIRLNGEKDACVMVRPSGEIFFRNRFVDPIVDLKSNTNFIQLNTDYICDIGWTGTMYYLKINNNLISSIDSAEVTILNETYLGIGQSGYYSTTSSIDLKAFSITVDGKEVFNGNKTGIDNIKADNYEVVGSPVISDDGVASGFSGSNFIKTPNVPELGKITESLRFTSSFVFNTNYVQQTIWNKNFNFDLRLVNSSIMLRTYDGSKPNVFSIQQSQHKIANGEQVFCDVVITPNLCRIKINGVEYTKEQVTDFSYLVNTVDKFFRIGMSNADDIYFKTSIDLNAFKIYVDGNLVYQPCLKIPYTQSKTGSKIVDVAYRDRVQNLYEQCGYTHYYTLGDTDFTLATCKGSDVIESGENYEQTADLTLRQWGSATSGQTVNLLPYKDTNYAVTLANGSKTKSSFVANATGDYFAVGKTVLG